ncbi:MAG: flagellar assembly protein FliH [Halioglobus sp.]
MKILSDQGETVQLWEAPFFEQPFASDAPPVASAEQEALVQARAFSVGKEEGLEAGRAEAQEKVAALTALIEALAQPFRGLDALVTKEVAQLAMRLAEQIVRRELTIDSDVVTDIVAEAMGTLYKLSGDIVVFLNPVDVELVRECAPESLEGKSWKVVEDANLLPGGCQVKTPTSFVDASVEKQIEEVFATLLESCDQALGS